MDQYLTRFAYTKDGTFGRLGRFITVEEEWQDNQPNISCIPTGTYVCRRVQSPKFGNTFEVTEVPGRSHILLHALNTEEGSRGCIGPTLKLGVLRVKDEDSHEMVYKLAGLSARKGFNAWLATMQGIDQFRLHVVDYAPPAMELE